MHSRSSIHAGLVVNIIPHHNILSSASNGCGDYNFAKHAIVTKLVSSANKAKTSQSLCGAYTY